MAEAKERYFIADEETKHFICEVQSVEHGLSVIKDMEELDKYERNYTPYAYDIVNEMHESYLETE